MKGWQLVLFTGYDGLLFVHIMSRILEMCVPLEGFAVGCISTLH